MTSEIKQDLNQTYLILDEPVPCLEDYRFHMLLSNHIHGLLNCSVRSMDEHVRFYYDISGKRMLKEELAQYKINLGLLRNLLTELLELETVVQDYLLDLSCVILDPEYIYLDKRGFSFCYLPTWKKDLGQAFHELTGILLEYVDYQDEDATELLYTLHSRTRGTYHLRKLILDLTEQGIGRGSTYRMEEMPTAAGKQQESDLLFSGETTEITKRKKEARRKSRQEKKEARQQERSERKARQQEESGKKVTPLDLFGRRDQYIEPEFPWLNEGVFEEDPKTTYLDYSMEGKGLSLNAENSADRMVVKETPYVIGSDSDRVDGFVGNPTVSHIHASIHGVAGCFFLQDENSRNGTYVNGRKLDMGERVKLSPGDRVMFANLEYRVTPLR